MLRRSAFLAIAALWVTSLYRVGICDGLRDGLIFCRHTNRSGTIPVCCFFARSVARGMHVKHL